MHGVKLQKSWVSYKILCKCGHEKLSDCCASPVANKLEWSLGHFFKWIGEPLPEGVQIIQETFGSTQK